MKHSLRILGLLITMAWLTAHAQPNENTAVLARSACNAIFLTLGWKDGQAMPLKDVQEILRTMRLPEGYSITPQNAINSLASLNASDIPEVVFHCTQDEQEQAATPDTFVRFYFSYVLPDQTPMKTSEFVVKKTSETTTTATTNPGTMP